VWLQAVTAVSVAGVLAALAVRLLRGWPARAGLRLGALGLVAASVVGMVAFALQGPLKPGWARRAGTPPALLAAAHPPPATRPVGARARVDFPFTASLEGTSRQLGAHVDIAARLDVAGGLLLHLRLDGRALPGGGLEMVSSRVELGPSEHPDLYHGRVVALRGNLVEARLAAAGARAVRLRLALRIDSGDAVAGTADAREVSA
jgi:hypothetical protein